MVKWLKRVIRYLSNFEGSEYLYAFVLVTLYACVVDRKNPPIFFGVFYLFLSLIGYFYNASNLHIVRYICLLCFFLSLILPININYRETGHFGANLVRVIYEHDSSQSVMQLKREGRREDEDFIVIHARPWLVTKYSVVITTP